MSEEQKVDGKVQEMLNDPNVPGAVKQQLRDGLDTSEKKPEIAPVVVPPPAAPETVDTDKPEVKEIIPPSDAELEKVDTPAPETKDNLEDLDTDYQQKYLTLKGKFDAEVPRLQKAITGKDEVILWQKEKITELESRLKSAVPNNTPANVEISEEAKKRLAELGYDDPDDLEAFRTVAAETAPAPAQEVIPPNVDTQAYDGLLLSDGFVDSRSMQNQPHYQFAMDVYKEFGTPAREFLDKALASKDFETAAAVLARVQSSMIRDGYWNGPHPLITNNPPVAPTPPVKEPVKAVPRPVLPHSKTVIPEVKAPTLGPNALTEASTKLSKGQISFEEYSKIKNQFVQEQQGASPG